MSSWIPSLFNPFSDDDDDPTTPAPNETTPKTPSSGAKDDLSAVFRGVAAFLAPPQTASLSGPSSSSSETIVGIKNDLAEIQGSFRSGLSLISSKFTSNLLQFQSQLDNDHQNDEVEEKDEDEVEEEEDAVGINEEVLDFVGKISGRPELWTDFPLSLPDDFDLSDYQREHAANIDDLVPDFVTLRQKICSQMSNAKFWLIYFILLLPRLNDEDLELLLTPQVAEARETLLKKLQNKTAVDQETDENLESSDTNKEIGKGYSTEGEGGETTYQREDVSALNPIEQREIVSETESGHRYEEIDTRTSTDPRKQSEDVEDDVSFSDLEDDDNDLSDQVSKSDKVLVQLDETSDAKQKADQSSLRDKESESEESNDWLTVDDTDFDNLAAI